MDFFFVNICFNSCHKLISNKNYEQSIEEKNLCYPSYKNLKEKNKNSVRSRFLNYTYYLRLVLIKFLTKTNNNNSVRLLQTKKKFVLRERE